MKLYIDPSGGIAGDMFAAALISAGADKVVMLRAMKIAAEMLGTASLDAVLTEDGATRLNISIDRKNASLSGHQTHQLLQQAFSASKIETLYQTFGVKALQILIDAELKAHRENPFLTKHAHHHHETPHTPLNEDAFLHEAQDILIDIMGASMGLQLLRAPVEACLVAPVSLGGGYVAFSHGRLPIPAPATKNIFEAHGVPGIMGPIESELCTPTGAALLAALKVKLGADCQGTIVNAGTSRGSRNLPVPALAIRICKSEE